MKTKNLLSIVLAGALIFSLVGCQGEKSETENNVVKIGIVGDTSDQWEPVIKNLTKEGINVKLVPFSDYTQPNQALEDKEINLNSFQTYAYLNKDIEDRGFELSAIGETIIAPLGIYSNKIQSVDELKNEDSIAIPSDATNGGRALKVLEESGVIKVDEAAGYTPTLDDIVENPKNIKFVEVEAAQTPRLLEDVEAAVINGAHAVDSGLSPKKDSIYLEDVKEISGNPYINVIAARTEDKDNEVYKKIVEAFRSDEVIKVIEDVYKGSYIPTWK